jgi:hypothetical protein
MQHHDRQERADVERRRGAIEADIGRDLLGLRQLVEHVGLRDLVDKAAAFEDVKKI